MHLNKPSRGVWLTLALRLPINAFHVPPSHRPFITVQRVPCRELIDVKDTESIKSNLVLLIRYAGVYNVSFKSLV